MVITVRTGESLFEVGKDLRGERRAHGRHLVAKSAQFADLAIRLEVLQHLRMRNPKCIEKLQNDHQTCRNI
jgi:hypothetical protein